MKNNGKSVKCIFSDTSIQGLSYQNFRQPDCCKRGESGNTSDVEEKSKSGPTILLYAFP